MPATTERERGHEPTPDVPAPTDHATGEGPARGAGHGRRGALRLLALAVGSLAIVALAWWMTGPAPEPVVDAELAAAAPQLVPPPGAPEDGALATAAARLAVGQVDEASDGFAELAAADPDDPVPQVGLALARWTTLGPRTVERDLRQLDREYPGSSFVAFHLGLARQLQGQEVSARAALADAVERARSPREAGAGASAPAEAAETGWRMARLADDLLHPEQLRGYPPILLAAGQLPAAERAALRELVAALAEDDRARAARRAGRVAGNAEGASATLRAAAAVASYDKQRPDQAREEAARALAAAPAGEREAVRLQLAMIDLWRGERAAACRGIDAVAAAGAGTAAELAGPIAAEACAGGGSGAGTGTAAVS